MKITIKAVPPSLNKFSGRKNVWEYRKMKKEWTMLVKATAMSKVKSPAEFALVRIDYFFKTRVRHDSDNYCGKFILDGLTAAGVIIDDDFEHIALLLHGHYNKENPRTEITVTPVDKELLQGDERA
ncbi:MAG: RusA family crossover junction endodeoxyribonuclease [Oscillospiraceae bacterium]